MTLLASRTAALTGLLFAGFIPLLIVAPTLVPMGPSVLSAASVEGYNTGIAFLGTLLWAVTGMLASLLAFRIGWLDEPPAMMERTDPPPPPTPRRRWLERAAVAALVTAMLWPAFLARWGPYIEDRIFITALHRMHGGMVPYRDFEFLYGPLMLIPASWWSDLVGYSMKHYYAYLAILEVLQYVVILALLQHLVPRGRTRLLLFIAFGAFLMDPILGLNYNGIRKLLPIAGLLLITRNPLSARHAISSGVLLGLGVAYAHDYGLAGLVASAALFGLLWLRAPGFPVIRAAALLATVAMATALVVAFLLLREGFPAYLTDTRSLVSRFSAGEQGFRFYWTGNSLAGFALLSFACVVAGRCVARWRDAPLEWGDAFFVVAIIATVLLLKGGLNRSDVWHLGGAFLPMVVAFLLPLRRRAVRWSIAESRCTAALLAFLAATYVLGNGPRAAFVANGWLHGAWDVAFGIPRSVTACAPSAPAPCIESERTWAREEVTALGAFLAEPAQRDRRVLWYGEVSEMGPAVGVYKRERLNDSFIVDDARGIEVGRWIGERPDGIVVMHKAWYERLFAVPGADTLFAQSSTEVRSFELVGRPNFVESVSEWLASVHYRGKIVEGPIKELRWRRTVGVVVRRDFVKDREMGNLVVLSRRSVP